MKIVRILRNPEGEVVVGGEVKKGLPRGGAPAEGWEVEEIQVPDDYIKDLATFFEKHKKPKTPSP